MGFPESVLTSDEEVVLHLHPHWKALLAPFFWLVIGAAAIAAGWVFLGGTNQIVPIVITVAVVIALAIVTGGPWLRWRTTHYVFTNERVILREGIISRSGRDIPLGRVNDVSFSHGLVERALGCGTLTIESAGERGQVVLTDIPRVEKTQSILYELVEADRDQHTFDDGDRDAIVRDLRGDLPEQPNGQRRAPRP